MAERLDDLLRVLRRARGETDGIEVKSAAGGLPSDLITSICALANRPGGGWIILGLDEHSGFRPSGLQKPQTLAQGLVSKARACHPPVDVAIEHATEDGQPVILAQVKECAPSAKPCRTSATGRAHLRAWDGDFQTSPLEEQAFLAQREQPRFDRRAVTEATAADLDEQLVDVWARTAADSDPNGLGRFSGRELLVRAGVLTPEGVPTVAGLLTLGRHPQQFRPRFVVNLAVERGSDPARIRAKDVVTVAGPIPVMLESAVEWARKVFDRRVLATPDGSVRDAREYPLEAFRELIGNALVHRDLDSWSEGRAVEVRLKADRLIVSNPGGLHGISLDRLGREGTTSARNGRLVEICKYARARDGGRVVETLASGIPRILDTVRVDGLPEPTFHDNGISFTAILRQSTPAVAIGRALDATVTTTHASGFGLKGAEGAAWNALSDGPVTVDELQERTGLKAPTLRAALRRLASKGLTETIGGRGRPTTYRRLS